MIIYSFERESLITRSWCMMDRKESAKHQIAGHGTDRFVVLVLDRVACEQTVEDEQNV